MKKEDILHILKEVESGTVSADKASELLSYRDLGFATVDTSRKLRHGTCEVIYGEGKNREQTEKIITALFDSGEKTVIVTRIDKDKAEKFENAKAVIAIAGMEGALASVIGGLAPCPVIAVPTSVGYGASFGGIGALLSMLNSCASNVSTVNIDNGFSAAYIASMINHQE